MREDAGLSLLELCVVLAILMTVTVIGIPTLISELHSVRALVALASQVVIR